MDNNISKEARREHFKNLLGDFDERKREVRGMKVENEEKELEIIDKHPKVQLRKMKKKTAGKDCIQSEVSYRSLAEREQGRN